MNRKILDIKELACKPEWSEVLKLYSDLFKSESLKSNFVINLSQENMHLASQCLTTSIKPLNELEESLKEKAISNFELQPIESILTLLELNDADRLFLSKRNTFRNPYGKRDKKYFELLMNSVNHNEMLIYLNYVINLKKLTFLIWLVPYLNKFQWTETQKGLLFQAFNRLFKNKYYVQAYELYALVNENDEYISKYVIKLLEEKRKDAISLASKFIIKHNLERFNISAIKSALEMKSKQLIKVNTTIFFNQ
ncbi:hypothetical protein [Kaistella rhinocerotis]|uniref:hypothetical protein n=1 Tax=Kaistella rhinocerotis TaxID=3026437 RepID=UPI0025536DD4|nr:hypothetical protein [Kaistella sp. Ran72]